MSSIFIYASVFSPTRDVLLKHAVKDLTRYIPHLYIDSEAFAWKEAPSRPQPAGYSICTVCEVNPYHF